MLPPHWKRSVFPSSERADGVRVRRVRPREVTFSLEALPAEKGRIPKGASLHEETAVPGQIAKPEPSRAGEDDALLSRETHRADRHPWRIRPARCREPELIRHEPTSSGPPPHPIQRRSPSSGP